jgi:hypothetical protein
LQARFGGVAEAGRGGATAGEAAGVLAPTRAVSVGVLSVGAVLVGAVSVGAVSAGELTLRSGLADGTSGAGRVEFFDS